MNNINQNIDTLKKLWQDQKLKDDKMNTVISPNSFIIKRLKAFEKLQLRINIVKIAVLIFIMGSFIWYLFRYSNPSPLVLLSLFWIVACLTIFIIIYWRKQFQADQLNFSLCTSAFIDQAIDKLNEQRKVFRSIFPFLVIGLIVGLNLLYLGILVDLTVGLRLLYHLFVSVILAGLIPIGFKIRNWKFKKENQPVIDNLLNFKNEIEE
jgi:membrane protein YdbS with pleckstrin-like domain